MVNSRVKNFKKKKKKRKKKPAKKELKPNPTLIMGDLVCTHRFYSQSPNCESRYRDTMVERTNCCLAQWFHPVGVTGERRLPAVNPGMGPTIGETVIGAGVTPGW